VAVNNGKAGGASKPLLKDVAYDAIKRRIIRGELRPGDWISERQLAVELEMSETPLKAAIEKLSDQGFIDIAPQRRGTVRALTSAEISDHYELRGALESFALRQLVGRITPGQSRRIEANLALQREITQGDVRVEVWTQADFDFHHEIAVAAGNRAITRVLEMERERLQWLVSTIALRDPSVPPISCREHEEIYGAALRGDADTAARLLEEHLAHGRMFLTTGGTYGH